MALFDVAGGGVHRFLCGGGFLDFVTRLFSSVTLSSVSYHVACCVVVL